MRTSTNKINGTNLPSLICAEIASALLSTVDEIPTPTLQAQDSLTSDTFWKETLMTFDLIPQGEGVVDKEAPNEPTICFAFIFLRSL